MLPMTDAPAADAAAEQVTSILQAAERTAEKLRRDAEQEAARIVEAAEAEASQILGDATDKGLIVVADAERAADHIHREAEVKARELVRDARQTAEAVRTEGVTISADLREMGSSLRVNAERLLGDVQIVHARLRADIDHLERRAKKGWAEEAEESDAGVEPPPASGHS
jgi:cell division septum initiation protein DivIVA